MRRALAVLVLTLVAPALFAQADQQIVSAVDAPDPVIPGNDFTYTVTVQNNGPNPAVNGGLNVSFPGSITFVSAIVPAGFTCSQFGQAISCTSPSFPPSTAVMTLTFNVPSSLLNFPDGNFSTNFSTSGVTPDPVPGNNNASVTTSYDSPQIDLQLSVTDAPDPVAPNGTITYTVPVVNNGPDTATSVNFNSFNNGSLKYQSITIPAGWSCPSQPAVGGTPTFTCTRASFPTGITSTFTIVVLADANVLGANDGTVSTAFGVNGTGNDTNQANNNETEDTAYVTPDADMQVTASDSPDPVFPDGDITYTVTVTNAGPDTATNAILNVVMNNTLRFQSVVTPAGWACSPPAVGGGTSWSCTRASYPTATPSVFTIVLRANDEQFGINDQTIMQTFTAGSSLADPVNGNNAITVSTQYSTPDANMSITASDAPDPVVNGANLTYTITVANAGPDAGPNATMNASADAGLTFQSLSAPGGWSCTTPAVDASGPIQCTFPSFANGASANFTLVMKVVKSGSGGTLSSTFTTGSNAQDPNNANNSITVFTNWIGQSSDLALTKNTVSTAAAQGSTITYTLSTINNGPDAATNVTVTDVLPSQLRFQSISAPAGWVCTTPAVGTNGTVSCTAAVLANGATANFTLVTTVAPTATGSISNTANVGFTGGTDPTPGNSGGSSSPVIVGGNSDLGVTKTTLATSAVPGATISYTINVTNNGPDPAASVVMNDVMPVGLLFQSISAPGGWSCTTPSVGGNGVINCTAATLAVSATATFTLTTTVANNATGTITNTATGSHSGTDGNGGNNGGSSPSLPVTPTATTDLTIAKSTTSTSVAPGGTLTYTITATNNGPSVATGVTVTDTLPAGTTFLSAIPSQGSCIGTTTVTCNLGTLNSGASATIALTVTVTATTGTITNTATITGTESDPNGGNNSGSTPPIPVQPTAEPEDIPTLSEWALIALAMMLLGFAARKI